MTAELALPGDPAGLPYDDLVAAWHEVDSRSAWFKARLAAAVPRGKLKQYAADVGAAYSTVASYRSVGKAYAEVSDVRNIPFGAAETLMAQEDHLELVSREKPWTVREARELVAERGRTAREIAAPPDEPETVSNDLNEENSSPEPEQGEPEQEEPQVAEAGNEENSSEPEQETGQRVPDAVKPPAAEPDPAPCPGCRNLEAKLKAADEQITRLKAARPDAVLTAEKEFLADQNAALAARVRELEAKLSAAPGGPVRHDPGTGTQTQRQDADGGSCARCGQPGAPVLIELPDGETDTKYACDPCLVIARRKQPEVTFTRPEPVTSEVEVSEIYASFDFDEAAS